MRLVGGMDRTTDPSPRARDVGRLCRKLSGSDNDMVYGLTLGPMARECKAIGKLFEFPGVDLPSLGGVDDPVFDGRDTEGLTVDELGGAVVCPD